MVVVNLITTTNGEIKKFLDKYYNENTKVDADVMEWIYVFNSEKNALKIIKSFMSASGKYNISLWVQLGDGDLIPVKKKNYDSVLQQIENNKSVCNV